jgi:uncharacterized protein with HEPN domain
MLLASRKVLGFAQGMTWERFRQDEIVQNAAMHLIQIIGEAARKVSAEFTTAHPEIPRKEIVGMRHRLVHDYFRIIPERVWDVIEKDLSVLVAHLEPLVPPENPPSES